MTDGGEVQTSKVREAHRFDEARLADYLRGHIAEFAGDIDVRQFAAGQSNPTYQITSGGRKFVLRKKPPGNLLPSAHAVDREFRIISALQDSDVPVPRALHLCQDPDIIGTDFFGMEMVEGRVFHDPGLPGMMPEERTQFFDDFARVLATLHSVDYVAAGLEDFGRASGYLERQVSRWSKQYEASKTEEIPSMDRIMAWLPDNLPVDQSVSIVHGDYRPGNTITHPSKPKITALLDWELSTIGHPLADLGYCCASYHGEVLSVGEFSSLDHDAMGIPSEKEFVERYCHYAGRDQIEDFHYFVIFSLFRSTAIIQGVYKRGLDGNASSEDALNYGELAKGRADAAWKLVEEYF